jgi:hypothetical protein
LGDDDGVIAQTEFLQRQFPKHFGIADAALRKFDDFLGDNSCRRIITNFQKQRIAGRHEGSGCSRWLQVQKPDQRETE